MVIGQYPYQSIVILCLNTIIPLINLPTQLLATELSNRLLADPRPVLIQSEISNIEKTESLLLKNHYPIPLEEDLSTNNYLDIHLVIKLSERRVFLYQAQELLISYPIAIGKAGWETPTGNFQIIQMIRNPAWEHPWTGEIIPPGLDNPLGERWIGFWSDGKNYIGFHGTPAEELIGQAVSHGCIRMFNKDVKALFEKVAIGTPVIVVD